MIKSMCQQPAQGFTTTWVLESENISLRKKGKNCTKKYLTEEEERNYQGEGMYRRIQRTKTTTRTATKKVVYTEERGVSSFVNFVATCCLIGFGRVEGFV